MKISFSQILKMKDQKMRKF